MPTRMDRIGLSRGADRGNGRAEQKLAGQAAVPSDAIRVIPLAANTVNVVPPGHEVPIHTSAAARR